MAAWDENKRLSNLVDHGVDFRNLTRLDWGSAVVFEDRRKNYGETRLIAMAKLGARLHVVVFAMRNGEVVISWPERPIVERWLTMRGKLERPSPREDAEITRAPSRPIPTPPPICRGRSPASRVGSVDR